MPAECRAHPSRGKEDVAGLLDLPQQLEAGTDVLDGRCGPQRVVQIAEAVEHPRLVTPVRHVGERREEPIALGRIRRQRRGDELQSRLPIRIRRSVDLLLEDGCPRAGHVADGKRLRERDEVGLGKGEARDDLLAPPDARSSQPTVSGVNATARSDAMYAPFWLRVACAMPGPRASRLRLRARDRAGRHRT